MKTLIINDIHIGTHRQAGTTPVSQAALKEYIQDKFRSLVHDDFYGRIIINGDLFDTFTADSAEFMATHVTLSDYLHNGGLLALLMGNHDASAKADKVSSFHLLAYILECQYPGQVQTIDDQTGFTQIEGESRIWAIPHMLNQDLFDIEIEKAAACHVGNGYLLLHCNIDSPFAEHADHSLNLNQDQIERLVKAGWTMIVGHEHQQRYVHGKRVIVTGNQIPSSVADCLHNPNNIKQNIVLMEQDDILGWVMEDATYLNHIFKIVDWRNIDMDDLEPYKFIRVEGNATSDEAADMVAVVAKLRQKLSAFVITNAVKVDGVAQMEALAEMSMENVSKFDILEALLEELDDRERDVVKGLLK